MEERDKETYGAEFWKDHLRGYLIHQKVWWVVLKEAARSQELKFFENYESVTKGTIGKNNKEG